MFRNTITQAFGITFSQVKAANPDSSFSENVKSVGDYERYADVLQPAFDPITQRCVEIAPTQVGGVWTQQWSIVAIPQAEVDEAARIAAVESAISSDSTVSSLKAMTNAEFDAWWSANVTNLAQAGNVLKRVTRIVLRRVL